MKFFLPFLTLLSVVAAGKTESAERKLPEVFAILDPSEPMVDNFVASTTQATCYMNACGEFGPNRFGEAWVGGGIGPIQDLSTPADNNYYVHSYDGSGGYNYMTSTNTDPVCSSHVNFDVQVGASTTSTADPRTLTIQVLDITDTVVYSAPVPELTIVPGALTSISLSVFLDLSDPEFNGCVPDGKIRFAWLIPEFFTGPAQCVLDNLTIEPLAAFGGIPQFGGLSTATWQITSPVDTDGNPDPIQYNTNTGEFVATLLHGTGSGEPNANMRIFANPSGPDKTNPAGACMTNGGTEIGPALSIGWLDNEHFAPFGLTSAVGSTYSFELSPDVVNANANPNAVYAVDTAPNYIVNFCLVFGLTDPSVSGDTISFYEVGLLVEIDMTNEFTITGFETQAVDPTTDAASNDFEVYYLGCPPPAAQNPFDQFEVISICLCPTLATNLDPGVKTNLVKITGMDEVRVEGEIPGTNLAVVQEIFEDGLAKTSAAGQFPLTGTLQGCFQVDFLTDESFFPNNAGPTVPLTIKGSAVLAPNRRRHLRNSRALVKAGEEATFTAEIEVIPDANGESASGRWTVTSTAGVVLGAAGALMI